MSEEEATREAQRLKDVRYIADYVSRYIISAAQYPQFGAGGVPVEVAAEVYGKDAGWVRGGIINGWLPIGHAICKKERYNYYISPKKLWEDTGYVWKG